MNIREFKIGDVVTKTEDRNGRPDRSFLGEKLTFVGIANGCAYFERAETIPPVRIGLLLDRWCEGWEHWQDIETINDSNVAVKYNLRKEVVAALANEDYELIAELKLILDSALASANTKQ